MSTKPGAETIMASKYAPLHFPGSIRLLYVLPGHFGQPIHCCLEEIVLECPVRYAALSYAWGEPIYSRSILISKTPLVNSRRFANFSCDDQKDGYLSLQITESLHEALQYLRHKEEMVVLWADAVCIDQTNLRERNSQIQLMTQIYQAAARVLIWLGTEDEHSAIAFDWALQCFEEARRTWSTDTGLSMELFPWPTEHFWSTFPVRIARNQAKGLSQTFHTFSNARKWWQRRWVVQELAFAREAMVICGKRSIDWRILEGIELLVRFAVKTNQCPESIDTDPVELSFVLGTIGELREFRQGVSGGQQTHSLSSLLNSLCHFQVSDMRDNLYAALALSKPSAKAIAPDYRKSVVEVYIDGTMALISESQSLDPLCNTRLVESDDKQVLKLLEVGPGAPSWVIDLGYTSPYERLPSHLFSADNNAKWSWMILGSGITTTLKVRGLFCDEIDLIACNSDPRATRESPDGEGDLTYDTSWRLFMDGCWPEAFDHVLRAIWWDCDKIKDVYALWRWKRLSSDEFFSKKESFVSKYRDALEDPTLREMFTEMREEGMSDDEIQACIYTNVLPTYTTSQRDEEGWRFCRFVSGRRGWVPDGARPGDLVYILFGGKVPFVLRPSGQTPTSVTDAVGLHATIVGLAYVQDVMDGELVASLDSIEDNEEIIYLH